MLMQHYLQQSKDEISLTSEWINKMGTYMQWDITQPEKGIKE